jgi:hypothetical protein
MRNRVSLASLTISAILISSINAYSANPAKPGAICSKAGATQISKGFRFTCVKSGKKLVWNKGVVVTKAQPSPSASPTPTRMPSANPSATPSQSAMPTESPTPMASPSPSKIFLDDRADFKSLIFYRLNNGKLERQSVSGQFFASDSRSSSAFDPIRVKAFEEIGQVKATARHPNVEFVWDIRPSFPKDIQDFKIRKVNESAEFFNSIFKAKIKVYGLLATEKDFDYPPVKSSYFSDTRESLMRLPMVSSKSQLTWISGGGGYWTRDGETAGKLFLGTSSTAETGSYRPNWFQLSAHEFFHIVQQYILFGRAFEGSNTFNDQVPNHFREGSADFIGYALSSEFLGWYSDAMDNSLSQYWNSLQGWQPTRTEADMVNLLVLTERREDQKAFELGYPLGSIFYEWMVGTYGYEKFLSFIDEMGNNKDFNVTIQKSFGMSKLDFYRKAAPYILSVFNRVIN